MSQPLLLTLSLIANVVLLSALLLMWTKARSSKRCIAALQGDIGALCAERERRAQLFLHGRGVTLASCLVFDPKASSSVFDPREVRVEDVTDPQARETLQALIDATPKH